MYSTPVPIVTAEMLNVSLINNTGFTAKCLYLQMTSKPHYSSFQSKNILQQFSQKYSESEKNSIATIPKT